MERKIKYRTKTLKQLFELYEEQNSSINKEIAEKEKELIANEIKERTKEAIKMLDECYEAEEVYKQLTIN